MAKKLICLFLTLVIVVPAMASRTVVAHAEPSVSAASAVLIEADTGRVLYEKNAHERRSMASTTKIMTAMLVLESEELERVVDITQEMVQVEGSSMGLLAGDQVTLETLAYGILLESGNDAANAAAITLGGTVEGFVEMMNQRAAALGLEDTHFVTPSGLDAEEHYTTAYDLALLGAAAMRLPQFAEIVSQSSAKVEFVNPPTVRTLYNHNRLLKEMEGCDGVKTGFTKKSGRCLVTSCQRNGVHLIAVTLNAPDDWDDHKALMEYGFSQTEPVHLDAGDFEVQIPVVGSEEGRTVRAVPSGSADITLLKGEQERLEMKVEADRFLYAPISQGRVVGRIVYRLEGREVAEIPLVTAEEAAYVEPELHFFQRLWRDICRLFGRY